MLYPTKVQINMDDRRRDLLNRLEVAAKKPVCTDDDLVSLNDDFFSLGFQILYGLPEELQFRAAFHMCERYLPIFEKKQPGSTWVRQLLGDIAEWHRVEGDATPDAPDEADSADAHYHSGFTDLLVGYRFRDHPACLAAGVCGMILSVVWARARNVFLADDPIVIQFEKEDRSWWDTWGDVDESLWPPQPESMFQMYKPEHLPLNNVAFQAVYCRECLHVVEWLRAEEVWKYPEPNDLNAMRHGLKRWEDCECTFLTPIYVERGNSPDNPSE